MNKPKSKLQPKHFLVNFLANTTFKEDDIFEIKLSAIQASRILFVLEHGETLSPEESSEICASIRKTFQDSIA